MTDELDLQYYECKACGKILQNSGEIKYHMETVHPEWARKQRQKAKAKFNDDKAHTVVMPYKAKYATGWRDIGKAKRKRRVGKGGKQASWG